MNVLLGVTGSVAATLTPKLVTALRKDGHKVRVIATKTALYFFRPRTVAAKVYRDLDEWPKPKYKKCDRVLHIVLRDWADVLLIAPLSAHTLAKLAYGIPDKLLTCIARAWDVQHKPVIIAPAMNTLMWRHPATREHLAALKKWVRKLTVIKPISKKLACGNEGIGAMAPIEIIVAALEDL